MVSQVFMVRCALRIVPKSLFHAGSWLQKSHHEKATLNFAGADVRRSRWGRMPLIPFVLRCTHAGRSQGGCGGGESAKGIPMRPSLLLSTKCLLQQLQTQVCDVGKNLLLNIKPPKKPIRSAHHNRVEWTLRFNGTQNFFFSWSCLKILKAKSLFEGLDQTRSSRWNQTEQTFALNRSETSGRIL